jgi:hypothetical protein
MRAVTEGNSLWSALLARVLCRVLCNDNNVEVPHTAYTVKCLIWMIKAGLVLHERLEA